MMRRRAREVETVTFDFAPMVDIVLLLVIFFMLTSSIVSQQRALPLDLPTAKSSVSNTLDLPMVTIDAQGNILLNNSPVDLQQLASQIKPLVQKSEGVVALHASKQSNYGLVVQVMDVVKRAGGLRLALATQP